MWRKICLGGLLAAAPLFAQDYQDIYGKSRSCYYLKLGPGAAPLETGPSPSAVLGLGWRHWSDHSAVDLSTQYVPFIGERGATRGTFTIPRLQYLYYFTPWSATSFYAGGGLSYGRTRTQTAKFSGLMSEFTAGYNLFKASRVLKQVIACCNLFKDSRVLKQVIACCNLFKDSRVRMFIEANLTQPTWPTSRPKHRTFIPTFSLAVGVGF